MSILIDARDLKGRIYRRLFYRVVVPLMWPNSKFTYNEFALDAGNSDIGAFFFAHIANLYSLRGSSPDMVLTVIYTSSSIAKSVELTDFISVNDSDTIYAFFSTAREMSAYFPFTTRIAHNRILITELHGQTQEINQFYSKDLVQSFQQRTIPRFAIKEAQRDEERRRQVKI